MRMLTIHVDSFSSTITEKSRSKIVENPEPKTISVNEALLVLASVEKKDEYEKGIFQEKQQKKLQI